MNLDRGTAVIGPVLVIGTGLIGTSIALALKRAGVEVFLEDTDPSQLATAIAAGDASQTARVSSALQTGAVGRSRIPGKHGAEQIEIAIVGVMLADKPGELARLFTGAGEANINLEDVRIEHVLGRPSGLVEISVRPDKVETLASALRDRSFDVRI